MFFAFGLVVIDVIASPLATANREAGKFMEGLAVKLGAGYPTMDHARSAAAFCDRSYSTKALRILGGLKARTIGPKEGDQPRCQRRASARQVGEDFGLGMSLKNLSDSLVVIGDARVEGLDDLSVQLG